MYFPVLNAASANSNEAVLKTILPRNCKSFDIIVANAYDYDSLSDQVGCQLQIK